MNEWFMLGVLSFFFGFFWRDFEVRLRKKNDGQMALRSALTAMICFLTSVYLIIT